MHVPLDRHAPSGHLFPQVQFPVVPGVVKLPAHFAARRGLEKLECHLNYAWATTPGRSVQRECFGARMRRVPSDALRSVTRGMFAAASLVCAGPVSSQKVLLEIQAALPDGWRSEYLLQYPFLRCIAQPAGQILRPVSCTR